MFHLRWGRPVPLVFYEFRPFSPNHPSRKIVHLNFSGVAPETRSADGINTQVIMSHLCLDVSVTPATVHTFHPSCAFKHFLVFLLNNRASPNLNQSKTLRNAIQSFIQFTAKLGTSVATLLIRRVSLPKHHVILACLAHRICASQQTMRFLKLGSPEAHGPQTKFTYSPFQVIGLVYPCVRPPLGTKLITTNTIPNSVHF